MKGLSALTLILSLCLVLTGCAGILRPDGRFEAEKLAATYGFEQLRIEGPDYVLFAWLKIPPGGLSDTLHVYIEGDGLAWRNRNTPSDDPTPTAATAFSMAAADPTQKAVLYLARPGQYVLGTDRRNCNVPLWTSHRYSQKVVDNVIIAIDYVKNLIGAEKLALYGYSGGGPIAALVAEQRVARGPGAKTDVAFLGTVAANLDTVGWTLFHKVSPLSGSLQPLDKIRLLSYLPQIHVVGLKDTVVPEQFAERWCSEIKNAPCDVIKVPNYSHYDNWSSKWPELLTRYRPAELN